MDTVRTVRQTTGKAAVATAVALCLAATVTACNNSAPGSGGATVISPRPATPSIGGDPLPPGEPPRGSVPGATAEVEAASPLRPPEPTPPPSPPSQARQLPPPLPSALAPTLPLPSRVGQLPPPLLSPPPSPPSLSPPQAEQLSPPPSQVKPVPRTSRPPIGPPGPDGGGEPSVLALQMSAAGSRSSPITTVTSAGRIPRSMW